VSVAAPQAATMPALVTSARDRRASASAAIAMIQSTTYQAGHRPGASQSCGASNAATAATAGANHGLTPRRRSTSMRPALAPARRMAAAARNSGSCHDSQSCVDAPCPGSEIPRDRSRRRNGPNDATATTAMAGIQRPRIRTPARPRAKKPSRASALVAVSAAMDPDNGPRIGA
jgi:hypothetical protein